MYVSREKKGGEGNWEVRGLLFEGDDGKRCNDRSEEKRNIRGTGSEGE